MTLLLSALQLFRGPCAPDKGVGDMGFGVSTAPSCTDRQGREPGQQLQGSRFQEPDRAPSSAWICSGPGTTPGHTGGRALPGPHTPAPHPPPPICQGLSCPQGSGGRGLAEAPAGQAGEGGAQAFSPGTGQIPLHSPTFRKRTSLFLGGCHLLGSST